MKIPSFIKNNKFMTAIAILICVAIVFENQIGGALMKVSDFKLAPAPAPAPAVKTVVVAPAPEPALAFEGWNVAIEGSQCYIEPTSSTVAQQDFIIFKKLGTALDIKNDKVALLFGAVSTSTLGPVLTDFEGRSPIVMSTMISTLAKKGYSKVYGFWNNPNNVYVSGVTVNTLGNVKLFDLAGWDVKQHDGSITVEPKVVSDTYRKFINTTKKSGAATIFGNIKSSESGIVLTSMAGRNKVLLSDVIEYLKERKGVVEIYGNWNNPENLYVSGVKSFLGTLKIQEFDERRLGALWKTGKRVLKYSSETEKGRIYIAPTN